MSGKVECSSPLAAAVAGEPHDVRRAVEVIGQILTGSVKARATFDGFLHSSLGRYDSEVVCEARFLSSVGHITAGLALAAIIDKFDPPLVAFVRSEPRIQRYPMAPKHDSARLTAGAR